MSQIEASQGINTEAFASALPADQIPSSSEFEAPIINQNPFDQKRRVVKLAGITGLIGTATLAFSGAVGAQEASPVPSQNPDTALAGEELCPPGYHTGSTEVVSGALQNGDMVNVSFPDASPLPSGSPAVEEVASSPSPEPILVGGEPEEPQSSDDPPDPEEPITITDPETGETIVCFPDGSSPIDNVSLSKEELLEQLTTQSKSEITEVEYTSLETALSDMWEKHKGKLATYAYANGYGEKFNELYIAWVLDKIKTGGEYTDGDKGLVYSNRLDASAFLANIFIYMSEWAEDPELKAAARTNADLVVDYAITQVHPDSAKKKNVSSAIRKKNTKIVNKFLKAHFNDAKSS